jgi:acyl-CoA-binding protein
MGCNSSTQGVEYSTAVAGNGVLSEKQLEAQREIWKKAEKDLPTYLRTELLIEAPLLESSPDLKRRFNQAIDTLASAPIKNDSNELIIRHVYALNQQAIKGDCVGKCESKNEFDQMKFEAWAVQRGKRRQLAMSEFVVIVEAMNAHSDFLEGGETNVTVPSKTDFLEKPSHLVASETKEADGLDTFEGKHSLGAVDASPSQGEGEGEQGEGSAHYRVDKAETETVMEVDGMPELDVEFDFPSIFCCVMKFD